MRFGTVLNLLGKLILALSLVLLTPIPFSLFFQDGMSLVFGLSSAIGLACGLLLLLPFHPRHDLGAKDGFAIVVLSWLALALLGALPYRLSGLMPSFIDCFFESMSGFTTTGSTILAEVEILPKSLLFWRSLTHWLGGMGIVVLTLAILPLLGVGGMQLFEAEMPGPTKDRLAPRIQDPARILWSVYLLMTMMLCLLLMLGGVDFFDALCHAFATMATGGFSTHTASIAYFDSRYVELVIVLFMFLAGANFSLHFWVLNGRPNAYWKNEEFRVYLLTVLLFIAVITLANTVRLPESTLGTNLRDSTFLVVSIMTTTGFGTADYDQWPEVSKMLLLTLMFVGGCAGSTGGGIKVVRVWLFLKFARQQLLRLIHPRQASTIRLGQTTVTNEVVVAILGFLGLYLLCFLSATLTLTALDIDLVTGSTAVLTTLNNVGPGLAGVGPAKNFAHLPDLAKVVLSLCMLTGRLEIYTVVVLLTPQFWKMARRPEWRWQHRLSCSTI